jgi:hypothetical protein
MARSSDGDLQMHAGGAGEETFRLLAELFFFIKITNLPRF